MGLGKFDAPTWLMYVYLSLTNKIYVNPRNRIEQLLDTVGDGSGTTQMVAATGVYQIKPPAGEVYVINRLNVYIEDGVNEKFSASGYAGAGALANGIICTVQDSSGNLKTLTPNPITRTGHWNLVSGIDMLYTDFPAGSSDMAAVRWTFSRGGGPICLIGDNGESLQMNVRDNLGAGGSALVSHLAQVQGFKFRPNAWWNQKLPEV